MPEEEVKTNSIYLAEIKDGDRVMDYGCGTGTLCDLLISRYPHCDLLGLDVDAEILKIAEKKRKGRFKIKLFDGHKIPYPENAFDKVIATWVFHHLTEKQKVNSLNEIHRVLAPKGLFLLADWGKPRGLLQSVLFFLVRLIDNFETFRIHKDGKFPDLIEKTGFTKVETSGYKKTLFGTLYYYVIHK